MADIRDDKRISTRDARQGRMGWPVLTVLIVALILCAIAFVVQMGIFKSTDDVPNKATKGVSSIQAPINAA